MKSNMIIPKKINVGYQNRSDTYTKKLAYIIYYDEKGTLRKEVSWNSWRDKELGNDEFDNVPTSGFVLNKKVGGYASHWNHRQTYVRVYDPRGFEFEIDVVNLLYILENTSSIKGKGLEGEFIYAWDKKELILLPVESPDYKEIQEYNKVLHSDFKLKGKDLKLGATYLTKDNKEWIYLGRFDKWQTDYDSPHISGKRGHRIYPSITKGKAYFFKRPCTYGNGIEAIKSLNKFIDVVSEDCVEDYAELMEMLERDEQYSPIEYSRDEYVRYTDQELKEGFGNGWKRLRNSTGEEVPVRRDKDNGYYYDVLNPDYDTNRGWMRQDSTPRYIKVWFDNIEELNDKLEPCYLRRYLMNGKLYLEDK